MSITTLERTPRMPKNLCIHGFNVLIRDRTMKRATTILKHSRFLKNMKITPIYPPEPEPSVHEEEGEGEEVVEDDDS